MKKLYYLWQFMKGNRALYIIAIAAIGIATFLSFLWPMVLRITVDSIIGDKALEAQGWLKPVFFQVHIISLVVTPGLSANSGYAV